MTATRGGGVVIGRCAMCTHTHLIGRVSVSDANDRFVWLCALCAGYVEDDNPWSATEMCTVGMTDESEMEPY